MDNLHTLLSQQAALWARIWARLGNLPDDEFARPLPGGESAQQILLHLSHWHDHARDGIAAMLAGREPLSRADDYDDWNARWEREDRACSVAEARRRVEESRRALLELVTGIDPAQVSEEMLGWLDANTREHYAHHLADLDT